MSIQQSSDLCVRPRTVRSQFLTPGQKKFDRFKPFEPVGITFQKSSVIPIPLNSLAAVCRRPRGQIDDDADADDAGTRDGASRPDTPLRRLHVVQLTSASTHQH